MEVHGYQDDLAYIHDAGFRDYALKAAPGLLRILRQHRVTDGLVVDLGCGSGRLAAELNRAGYRVLGIDQSPAMIRMARRIAPQSEFRVGSLWRVKLPACDAISSVGECLNYCFDSRNGRQELSRLFRRVYRSLRPGSVFVFDVAEPDRLPKQLPHRHWVEGRDWAVLVEVDGDRRKRLLNRHIVSFRKTGQRYRRSEETHRLRLYRVSELLGDLARCGFQASSLSGYGKFHFPPGISGALAVKPDNRGYS